MDTAPTTDELTAAARSIIAARGGEPVPEVDLARAVPLMAATIEQIRGALADAQARALNVAATWFEQQCPDRGGSLPLCMCHAAVPLRDLATATASTHRQVDARSAGGAS